MDQLNDRETPETTETTQNTEPTETTENTETTEPAGNTEPAEAGSSESAEAGPGGAENVPRGRRNRSEEEREASARKWSRALLRGGAVAFLLVAAILLTFTLTNAANRKSYTEALRRARESAQSTAGNAGRSEADSLKELGTILKTYSLYSSTLDTDEMTDQALKAYIAAMGDPYAIWYTEEEYQTVAEQTAGAFAGIGAGIAEGAVPVTVGDETFEGLTVTRIYEGSPAEQSDLRVGDLIVGVQTEDGFQTVGQLGREAFVSAVRGEPGTQVTLWVCREIGGIYEKITVSCIRAIVESPSVTYRMAESAPDVAVVRISEFELTTPKQFREAVDACLTKGAKAFVFDVRENPGGDLRSIRAILSFFLQKDDLVIAAQDQDGKIVSRVTVGAVELTGDAAPCSVTEEQIGMYADLTFAILCDENTASAAEVFTASLGDYGLPVTIVGTTTFGKGIMQSILPVTLNGIKGYLRLTTHSYVTQNGKSYHGSGIEPTVTIPRKEGTEGKPVEEIGETDDNQLRTALLYLTN